MAVPTSNDVPGWESFSFDSVSAAGLQNVDVDADADATIQSESNSSSSASAENVTGNSGASSLTSFNSGIQADETGTNTFDVSADAGLQGLAGTTAATSAITSEGDAKAFTELDESAGIQDVTSLSVGGELSALGQSINSLSADAGSVVGDSIGRSKMTDQVEGLEANDISVSSDAGIQGLAQLSNSASAATTDGDALSTAAAEKLQGAELDGLEVGGVASVIGQTRLSNTASSETVVEAENGLGAQATATLEQADGLRTSNNPLPDSAAGIEVSSDATLTGLASFENSASAAATSGASTATATATWVDGARINSTDIGGVGSITGQTNFAGSADAANVTDGNSTSTASLNDADGLEGKDLIDVSSDAGLTGLNDVDLTASAASTGSAALPTTASSTAEATTLQGAQLSNNTDIGGVGTIGGQVDFNGSAASSNVTGNAVAKGSLASLAQGLSTGVDTESGVFGTAISSDGTVQGFANLDTSADASTTAGEADADAIGANIDGAQLGDLSIGGIGTVTGSANFAAAANAANVTGGGAEAANANAQVTTVDGLVSLSGDGIDISSDAGIQGLASIDLTSAAQSTGATGDATTAAATSDATTLKGAELNSLTDIGGVGSIAGQVSLGSTADAANVTGMASGVGTINTAEGLDLNAQLEVASDATVSGSTTVGSTANAATTNGSAIASSKGNINTGADLSGGPVDVGGIGSIAGQANFDLSASSSNVEGFISKSFSTANKSIGLVGSEKDGHFGIDVASDSGLSGMAIGSLTADSSSTAGTTTAIAGQGDKAIGAQLPSLNVGGISNLTGAAQLDSSATASNVGGVYGTQATAEAGLGQSVIGLMTGFGGAFDAASPSAPGEDISVTEPDFDDVFNITIASNSAITAQAFNNLNAIATSTSGDATASAGDELSRVAGIESNMDISIGGLSELMAQAQGTSDSEASSISGNAEAEAWMQSVGIEDLELLISSDSDLRAISSIVGDANADSIDNFADAVMTFDSAGIDGITIQIGGLSELSSTANATGISQASSVSDRAEASADMDATGVNDAYLFGSSDSDISGDALVNASISAITIGDSADDVAKAFGDFDAEGITQIEAGIGGATSLFGQAQVTVDLNASSVQGKAIADSANASDDPDDVGPEYGNDGEDIGSELNQITGIGNIELDGSSNGIITGTAEGDFITTASSISADAGANAAQSLRGIENLNLELGGSATINAVVNDTNYVSASSVSGNAAATASVDAIGLDGGDIQIAGDATIIASVNAQSDAVATTVG